MNKTTNFCIRQSLVPSPQVVDRARLEMNRKNKDFTIPAELHARSLVNFYCQYADRHMNLKFMRRVSERERALRQFVIVKKQIDASF